MLHIPHYERNLQDHIYEDIQADGRPIVIYGAGEIGRLTARLLKEHGIEPYVYAVDRAYYKGGMTVGGTPVCCYEELLQEADRYFFLLGIGQPGERVRAFMEDPRGRRVAHTSPYGKFAPMDYDFLKNNEEKFQETYALLSDDLSRKTMQAYINLKLSGDVRFNFKVFEPDQYFNEVTDICRGGTFVDCGAFTGDTAEAFARWSGGSCKGIVALEPDACNYQLLKKRVASFPFSVETHPVGAWSKTDTLYFRIKEGSSSHFDAESEDEVRVDALDNLLHQDVDLIKMDIEGAEMHALSGAQETIRRCHPVLAIAVYHKAEDLVTIPQYIKTFETKDVKYRFCLRKHQIFSEMELDLYALPERR